jgi:hypothetical protein
MGSVRERFEGSNNTNSNERIGRGTATDFTGMQSADGYVTITNKREGRSYVWLATCTKPGCMSSGIVYTHEYLVNGGTIKCTASGHDSASTEPVRPRPTEASVQIGQREGTAGSARQRADAVARAKEIAEMEGAQ